MKKFGILSAILLVVISNLFVLTNVYLNQSGEPESSLLLTERELSLYGQSHENSGMHLRLSWKTSHYDSKNKKRTGWLHRDRLQALGFDTDLDPAHPEASDYYRRQAVKKAYIVFEFEGSAWDDWVAGNAEEIEKLEKKLAVAQEPHEKSSLESQIKWKHNEKRRQSHLFAIDAGRDALTLRQRYPDKSRYMILEGVINMYHSRGWNPATSKYDTPYVYGVLQKVETPHINISKKFRSSFQGLKSNYGRHRDKYHPRFEVRLSVGSRFLPWIQEVRKLPEKEPLSKLF